MTNQEKEQILKLREEGLSYREIAKTLNLPFTSVSSFIARQNTNKSNTEICKNCGIKLSQTKGHRKKIFCSEKCRRFWWKSNPDKRNLKAYHECKCEQCGKSFLSYSKADRKYCSYSCYQTTRNRGKNNG
ncbi:helix-turn-helix domain-containing protein [Acholeplasma sp. OttesenSCG-928-E16]|nr:helix-turn-helix domain-containing protein [Acholeplasma sp. OttesenSCG-928-E16]